MYSVEKFKNALYHFQKLLDIILLDIIIRYNM